MEPYQRITLVYAVFSFASVLTDPVFSLYLNQQGYSAVWVGIILSSFSLVSIVVTPIIGNISDSWGRKPLVVAGIFITVFSYAVYSVFHSPLIIFATRGLEAIGYYLVVLVAVSKLEDIAMQQKKNVMQRLGMGLSIGKIGYVLGPLVGGVLAAHYGIISPFVATAIVMLGLGAWYVCTKTHPYPKLPLDAQAFNPIPKINEFLRIRPFKGLAIMAFVFNFSLAAMFVFLPLYIVKDLHLGIEAVGIAFFVQQIPMLLQFIGGKATDQFGNKKMMFLGLVLVSLGLVGVGLSKTFEGVLVALFINGAGQSLFGISALSLLSSMGQKLKREATFLGGQVSISRIGSFVGYLVTGIIVAGSDISTLFVLCGVFILLGVIVAEEFLISHPQYLPHPLRVIYTLFHPTR